MPLDSGNKVNEVLVPVYHAVVEVMLAALELKLFGLLNKSLGVLISKSPLEGVKR